MDAMNAELALLVSSEKGPNFLGAGEARLTTGLARARRVEAAQEFVWKTWLRLERPNWGSVHVGVRKCTLFCEAPRKTGRSPKVGGFPLELANGCGSFFEARNPRKGGLGSPVLSETLNWTFFELFHSFSRRFWNVGVFGQILAHWSCLLHINKCVLVPSNGVWNRQQHQAIISSP